MAVKGIPRLCCTDTASPPSACPRTWTEGSERRFLSRQGEGFRAVRSLLFPHCPQNWSNRLGYLPPETPLGRASFPLSDRHGHLRQPVAEHDQLHISRSAQLAETCSRTSGLHGMSIANRNVFPKLCNAAGWTDVDAYCAKGTEELCCGLCPNVHSLRL